MCVLCRLVTQMAILDDAPVPKNDVRGMLEWHQQQQRRHLLVAAPGEQEDR